MKKIAKTTKKNAQLMVAVETLRRLDADKLSEIIGGAATSGYTNCYCSGWGCN